MMKPASGFLLFVAEGVAKSASGVDLPVVSLSASQCSVYSYKSASAKGVKRVRASYSDEAKGVAGSVEVGAGEPAFTMAYTYTTKQEAEAAATAHLRSSEGGKESFTATAPLSPDLLNAAAEGRVEVSGFDAVINGLWRIDSADVSIKQNGGSLSVACDRVLA